MKITKEYLVSIIDSTLLKPNATQKDVEHLCEEAVMYNFGAVCVRPCDVRYVSNLLSATDVNVCTVIGFPWGIQTIANKIHEASEAFSNGVTEFDIVLNRSYIKDENYSLLYDELSTIKKLVSSGSKDMIVKAILETCDLTDKEIVDSCITADKAGIDFVKTSTGLYKGALVKTVKLMHKTVPNLGVKASGGIKDWSKTYKLIKAGANRIGTSSGVDILKGYNEYIQAEPNKP